MIESNSSEEGKKSEKWEDRDLSHFVYTSGEDLFDIHTHFSEWSKESKPGGYDLYEAYGKSSPKTEMDVVAQLKSYPKLINLASYNYLGLSYRTEVIEAAKEALNKYGLGAAGSPYLSGMLEIHRLLEKKLAAIKGTDDAILFPTGYSANIGAISALANPGDVILIDTLAHASIVDGAILSRAKTVFFRHNDPKNLAQKLLRNEGRKLVIVEGVYSMDGDIAPLLDIVEVCKENNARLMVDEAHSAFIFGEQGRGIVEHFGVEEEVDIHLGTLSKSMGGMGGYVAGSQKLIDYLRPYSRSQLFSCALSPPVVGGLLKALEIFEKEPELRIRLWENVHFMQEELRNYNVDIGESQSQVIPVMIKDDVKIFTIAKELMEKGVFLNPICYPAVKRHKSRFRISISAAHSQEKLKTAAEVIAKVLRQHGVLS